MQLSRQSPEQHIAVFGESGSGKTVLLSSFYGATQEPLYLQRSLFHVLADDAGQGIRLHRNYLGMRDSSRLPGVTRFAATSYRFTIRMKVAPGAKNQRSRPADTLRLVWHDYPGEWFEQEMSGPEEARRRIDTFRSLLRSDVALLLVDGQRLVDNVGEEERYLKSLLTNVRNGLLTLKDDLLADGKPLVEFPRIWILALSKADLVPDHTVFSFRDLVIDKAGGELDELRTVLTGLVEEGDALSVGEDFLLLSSAKFGTDKIEVTQRVGVEMLLPLAAMLPLERHARWRQVKHLSAKVAENLMGAAVLAPALLGRRKYTGPAGHLLARIGPGVLANAATLAGERLKAANAAALTAHNYLAATLTRFRMDLEEGEEKQILLRSRR